MRYCGILIVILLVAAAILAGCTQQQSAPQQGGPTSEIKVGVIASMTGPASNVGKNMWQSASYAADEINSHGGVYLASTGKNATIKLILADDESTQAGGQTAATRLVTGDKVDLLVGGYSSAVTSAYEQVVADNKVPFVVTGASSPVITHRTDIDTSYVFHSCPTTDDFGQYTTNFMDQVIRPAVNGKGGFPDSRPLRLALIYQDSPYGKGVLAAVNNTIAKNKLNIAIVSEQGYRMGESDFRTPLTAIKAANPDVVYAAAFPNEQGQMVPQARRDIGLNTLFIAVINNDAPEYYKALGTYGEYSLIESRFSPYLVPSGSFADAQAAFKQGYFTKYGTYPDMMGASTYEGVYIASRAAANAGSTDKAAVRQALSSLKMPEMIEPMKDGTISFSPDFRETQSELSTVQLHWDPAVNETRPSTVWPASMKTTDFVLPDWYVPGSA